MDKFSNQKIEDLRLDLQDELYKSYQLLLHNLGDEYTEDEKDYIKNHSIVKVILLPKDLKDLQ